MGIEPTYPAWKAGVLPLNYTRIACLVPESNQRHEDFQSSALPTELTGHMTLFNTTYLSNSLKKLLLTFVVPSQFITLTNICQEIIWQISAKSQEIIQQIPANSQQVIWHIPVNYLTLTLICHCHKSQHFSELLKLSIFISWT